MCATIVHFLKSHVSRPCIPPFTHCLPSALASALNKTGAFAKTSITGNPKLPSPSLGGGLGSASDLLAMTSRLKGVPNFHNHFRFYLDPEHPYSQSLWTHQIPIVCRPRLLKAPVVLQYLSLIHI